MGAKAIAALVAVSIATITAAQAEWLTRNGGALGKLVSNTNDGDELFFFCSRQGLNIGFVWRVSTKPGGPSDLTNVPVAVAIDGRPAIQVTFEGFDGAWVGVGPNSSELAAALPKAGLATVVIADSHADAFEAPRQEYAMTGFSAALAKARFPARCQPK